MIQRVQTLYLIILIIICIISFYFFPKEIEVIGFFGLDYRYIFHKYSFLLVALLGFISIFLYKKRIFQIYINRLSLLITLSFLLSLLRVYLCYDLNLNHYKIFIASLINFIIILLANRAIIKDKKLVDSINRLR